MRKRGIFSNKHSFDESLINLTPLIDVVFVVLIAFIVIAPLLEIDKINLASGKTSSTSTISKNAINIHVREDNSIFVNNSSVKLKELTSFLKKLKNRFPKKSLHLFHDKKAFFGTYHMVKLAAQDAGFEELDVVVKNSKL